MQPYQERVVAEKAELDEKLRKLNDFIPSDIMEALPEAEQRRLLLQLTIMRAYSMVLAERIHAFNN